MRLSILEKTSKSFIRFPLHNDLRAAQLLLYNYLGYIFLEPFPVWARRAGCETQEGAIGYNLDISTSKPPPERAEKKEKLQAQETGMGEKLRLRQFHRQASDGHHVLRERAGRKRKEDCRRRSLGDEPGLIEDKILISYSDAILSESPAHSTLAMGTGEPEKAEGLGGLLFLGLGLIFSWPWGFGLLMTMALSPLSSHPSWLQLHHRDRFPKRDLTPRLVAMPM